MITNDPKSSTTRNTPDGFTLGPPAVTGSYLTIRATRSGEWESDPFVAQWAVRDGLSWYRNADPEDKRYASQPREDGYTSGALTVFDTSVAHVLTEDVIQAQRRSVLDGMTIEQIEAYLEQRRAGR